MPEKIGYPSFVAKSGQVNTPPGSYKTIKTWIRESFMSSNSKVLEIGCSTGFISYQINSYTGAKVVGIDLSPESVEKAKKNCKGVRGCKFFVGDASKLEFPDSSFTHVIIGGHLPWVNKSEHERHIKEALRVLSPGGFLLTSLYYYSSKPPREFLDKFNQEFGTCLESSQTYGYWSSLFKLGELDLEYESNFEIFPPSPERKKYYLSFFDKESRTAWEKKVCLFEQNAKYISFFVKVFRKDANGQYRQQPRGGIYTHRKLNETVH